MNTWKVTALLSFSSFLDLVTEKWKPLAQELGAGAIDIQYFEARTHNHSMAILEQYGAHLTVNQLYKLLVRIGANAIADHLWSFLGWLLILPFHFDPWFLNFLVFYSY